MNFQDILKRHKRVAVCGGPVTGKSIVTDNCSDRPVFHSDDLMELGWSEGSQKLKELAEDHESFCVAGVAADRAIRKGLEVDAVIHCRTPRKTYSKGQAILKAQIDKRVRALKRKGIKVYELD